jgi:hypothetical protein
MLSMGVQMYLHVSDRQNQMSNVALILRTARIKRVKWFLPPGKLFSFRKKL